MKKIILIISLLYLFSCNNSSNISVEDNSIPTISGTLSDIRVGEKFFFAPNVYDEDGDLLTYSIIGKPDWLEFDTQSGTLNGIPTIDNLGDIYEIFISVSDGKSTNKLGPLYFEVLPGIFFISINVNGLDRYRNFRVSLEACMHDISDNSCTYDTQFLYIEKNDLTPFKYGISTGNSYKLDLVTLPGRQDCSIQDSESIIENYDVTIQINCGPDKSAPLFDTSKLHKFRINMTKNEWKRFILDSQRARYTTGDANKNRLGLITHSEIYRQVDFEYLNEEGDVVQSLPNVGFKMKGSSGRRWPEYSYIDNESNLSIKPKRFSFTLKFNETFDEDEGVYSCIDINGNPAAIAGHPCNLIIGKNLQNIDENKGRRFMDQKKIFFRFNRDDPSYQRELLAHDILNTIGIPSSRVSHGSLELVINGTGDLYGRPLPHIYNMGVYQIVEQVDKTFLKRFFGENGYLFKNAAGDLSQPSHTDQNCVPYEVSTEYENSNFCVIGVEKSDPISREEWLGSNVYLNPSIVNSDINNTGAESQFKPYRPKYDLKTKKDEISYARFLLQEFMIFLQNNPSEEALLERFDVNGFIKSQALEIAIGAVDHYVRVGNNYYLYFDINNQKWIYMPNDFDFVFRDNHSTEFVGRPVWANVYQDIAKTFAFPEEGEVDWSSRQIGNVDPILWRIVFSNEKNRNTLYLYIKEIIENNLVWEELEQKLIMRNSLIEDSIKRTDAGNPAGCSFVYDYRALFSDTDTLLCDEYDISIKSFIDIRKETLKKELSLRGY